MTILTHACRVAALAVGLLASTFAAHVAFAQTEAKMSAPTKWIDAWSRSYLSTTVMGQVQANQTFNNQTLRLNLFPTLGGSQARVKFTNKFTTTPMTIGAAHIAIRGTGNAIDPATDRTLKFKGEGKVTVAPGEEVWSDPVDIEIKQHQDVAVSVFIPDTYKPTGFHATALKNSYVAQGDQTAAASFQAAGGGGGARAGRGGGGLNQCFIVAGLQVMAPSNTKVIVCLGDSITDGATSANEGNASWPDMLFKRLPKLPDGTPVAVINAGIGSNRFVSADVAGPTGLVRVDDDVLARPNVTHLLILEGVNDISYEQVKPEDLINAYKQAITKAHAKGIKVYIGTILPIQNSRKDTPYNLATQQAVNKWIRTGEGFDGVIDFEKALQDPQNPLRLTASLQSDYVHPNTAGYKLMADTIDLKIFEK